MATVVRGPRRWLDTKLEELGLARRFGFYAGGIGQAVLLVRSVAVLWAGGTRPARRGIAVSANSHWLG